MAKARARLIDRNRYSKKYPFVRAPKRLTWIGDKQLAFELGSIEFSNEWQKTFTFEAPFEDDNFSVMAMPRDTTSRYLPGGNVNLYIPNTGLSRNSVTIVASAPFTGTVDIFAVRIADN